MFVYEAREYIYNPENNKTVLFVRSTNWMAFIVGQKNNLSVSGNKREDLYLANIFIYLLNTCICPPNSHMMTPGSFSKISSVFPSQLHWRNETMRYSAFFVSNSWHDSIMCMLHIDIIQLLHIVRGREKGEDIYSPLNTSGVFK